MDRNSSMVRGQIISSSGFKSFVVSRSIDEIRCSSFHSFSLQCFKSAWLYAFLHDGLKFPVNYQRLRSASLVNNNDVQWTLGAILYKTRFLPLRFVSTCFREFFVNESLLFLLERWIKWKVQCTIDELILKRQQSSLLFLLW